MISIDFLFKKLKKHDFLPYLALDKAIGGTSKKILIKFFLLENDRTFCVKISVLAMIELEN